jgi:hypothetical protein
MSVPVASKIRRPSSPNVATIAKSLVLVESWAAMSIASNCRWVSPSLGDSGGTFGRRTWSAGERVRISSMVSVR